MQIHVFITLPSNQDLFIVQIESKKNLVDVIKRSIRKKLYNNCTIFMYRYAIHGCHLF